MSKAKTLAQAAQEREMRQHVSDAMLALVKRAGEFTIPREALEDLKAGDSLCIRVGPEGIVLTYQAPLVQEAG